MLCLMNRPIRRTPFTPAGCCNGASINTIGGGVTDVGLTAQINIDTATHCTYRLYRLQLLLMLSVNSHVEYVFLPSGSEQHEVLQFGSI